MPNSNMLTENKTGGCELEIGIIEDIENLRNELISLLTNITKYQSQLQKTKTLGHGASIFGTVATIVGTLASTLSTGGTSITFAPLLAAGGACIGIPGGMLTLGADIKHFFYSKDMEIKIYSLNENYGRLVNKLKGLLEDNVKGNILESIFSFLPETTERVSCRKDYNAVCRRGNDKREALLDLESTYISEPLVNFISEPYKLVDMLYNVITKLNAVEDALTANFS